MGSYIFAPLHPSVGNQPIHAFINWCIYSQEHCEDHKSVSDIRNVEFLVQAPEQTEMLSDGNLNASGQNCYAIFAETSIAYIGLPRNTKVPIAV